MNALKLSAVTAVSLLASVVQAQVITIAVPDQVPLPASTLTRAEVIADYQMSRLAGLQALNRGESGPDVNSLAYRQALAKYRFLLASPQFAMLVNELSRNPNATVHAVNSVDSTASR